MGRSLFSVSTLILHCSIVTHNMAAFGNASALLGLRPRSHQGNTTASAECCHFKLVLCHLGQEGPFMLKSEWLYYLENLTSYLLFYFQTMFRKNVTTQIAKITYILRNWISETGTITFIWKLLHSLPPRNGLDVLFN